MGLEKERAKFRMVKARLNEGKNSPVDYFCDASASGPTTGTKIKKLGYLNYYIWKKLQNMLYY